MVKDIENQNYKELSESEIFEKARKELNPIQENLIEKRITIDEAKSELKKINEWIQWTKLEKKDKKEIWKAFEKLMKLEKNIDETTLRDEVNEVINLLRTITKKDLDNLEKNVKKNARKNIKKNKKLNDRDPEIQDWIDTSSNNFEKTVHEASEDQNPIAKKIGERMEKLMA